MTATDPYGNGNAPGFNGGGNVSPGAGVFDFTSSGSPTYWNSTSGEDLPLSRSFILTSLRRLASGPVVVRIIIGARTGNWNGLPIFPVEVTFAGSTRLVNNNDNTGITVDGITFDAAAGAFVLNGNDITLAGSIGFSADGIGLGANPAAPVTQTINLIWLLAPTQSLTLQPMAI